MKPLKSARRAAGWLLAAGLAFGMTTLPAMSAGADGATRAENLKKTEELMKQLRPADRPEQERGEFAFTKTGQQINCDYVVYNLRFGISASPEAFANPLAIDALKNLPLSLKDQLAPGLSIVDAQIAGDVTDGGGINPPALAIGSTAGSNDTLSIADFRLTAADLNGDGSPDQRYIDIKITAKIDHAAFPAISQALNQAFVHVDVGAGFDLPSQDPALPDDGDMFTGEPTEIVIDVTRCDPPGGGDTPEEQCFKVDTGTVDCDKSGSGDFIYHMNVGADMAGRVIELTTSNPGVTISPAAQVVPAGGGVLDWTISGASPGDVIHIVVVGTEVFAGPEEGWGICCTQTVDITIPEDLDCPDGKEPDLKVEKKADVETCTKAGGCKFTIRVSNVGDAPYNGPIVLNEVTVPGNGTIEGLPNVPWTCAPATSPMLCTHPATTLNPGEFVELKLSFMPGPAWNARFIENCARYNYDESGKPLFGSQLNDFACDRIDICDPNGPRDQNKECQPPVEKKADLQLRKIAQVFCAADGLCSYGVMVTNVGTVTHNGPLTVTDTFPGNEPTTVTFSPTPPWACASIGANQFQCDHPGIVLVPGASTVIIVRAVVPTDLRDPDIENCAEVKAIATETNLANNKACATAKLRQPDGKPALRITKVCKPAAAGGAVSCRITVNSVGTAAPVGPVLVNDAATIIGSGAAANILTVTPDGAEWACTPVPAANVSCQIPGAVMAPGASRHFDVTVQVSPNERFKNCAVGSVVSTPGKSAPAPFGEACDEGGTEIVVKKTGDAQCTAGEPCAFTVTITNNGDQDFSGPLQIGDAVELEGIGRLEGVAIQSVEPPFGCAPEPTALPFGCTANVSIPAGASQPHVVTIVIPDNDALANVGPNGVKGRNCVGVTGDKVTIGAAGQSALGETSRGEGGAFSCHPFTLVKAVEEKQCSEGFIKNAAGRCVCPEGTRFNNASGKCSGEEVKPEEPQQPEEEVDPVRPLCKLLPGQIRTKNGNCICPRGTELRQGACKRPVVELCKLLPGQIRTKDNRCICPRGTELRNGACKRLIIDQCQLLPGQIRTKNGNCICPRNTTLKNGRCETTVRQCTLLPGQIRTRDGKCICPRGTVLGRKGCVKIETPDVQCKIPGQIKGRNGQCFCPRPTRLIDGECLRPVNDEPVVKRCPRGTIGIYPVCVKPEVIQPRRCPRGLVGTPPNCRQPDGGQDIPKLNLRNNLKQGNQDVPQ